MTSLQSLLTGEMAVRSFAYHAHHVIGRTDSDKSFCHPSLVCVPQQNIKLAMHARSGLPPDDKSSYIC